MPFCVQNASLRTPTPLKPQCLTWDPELAAGTKRDTLVDVPFSLVWCPSSLFEAGKMHNGGRGGRIECICTLLD